jgi:histone H3/H4
MAKKEEVQAMAVMSRVKEHIKGKNLRCDGDLDQAISKMIVSKLDKAIDRCKANGRQTVRPSDL